MKKFDTEQMIFAIVLATVIIGIFIYRVLHPFKSCFKASRSMV